MNTFSQQLSRSLPLLTILFVALFIAFISNGAKANPDYVMKDFESIPISISLESATPQVQINASNDHQLFFKAYSDYGDLDDDGYPETTYKHSIDYYGYFDSDKCYTYDTGDERFEPKYVTSDKYCSPGNREWSGNFLNWASMTRIDAIRKILFGGHRRIDTKDTTVLERAFLPPDIHAFAKYYNRTDLPKLTPFYSTITASSETSSTPLVISFGTQVFKVNNATSFNNIGDYVEAIDTNNSTNFMAGTILAIDTGTNNVSVNVISLGGEEAKVTSWTFYNKTIQPETRSSVNSSSISIGTGTKSFKVTSPESYFVIGDYVNIAESPNSSKYMRGWVTAASNSSSTLSVNVTTTGGTGNFLKWNITNLTRTGITLCNVTYSSSSSFSEYITDSTPPLIRVADGNYSFWAAGEVHQCLWEDEDPGNNGNNYNNPEYSNIPAAQDNPYITDSSINADYVAKVVACVDLNSDGEYDSNDGSETCKQYPYGNIKPIGLLQEYGDNDELLFGMIAGTFGKSTKGGDMIMPLFMKNNGANNMCREINLGRDCDDDGVIDDLVDSDHEQGDGTFKKVFSFVGGPASKQDAEGVINSWSIYRIKGYQYGSWTYKSNSGDKCPLSIDFFGDSSSSQCQNWGNPFAEIYLTALRHWVGENAPIAYQAQDNDKGVFEGLNYLNGVWEDPLTTDNYCAPLNIINFNSSVISADTAFISKNDELDANNQGIEKDLDSPYSSTELTYQIGTAEGIHDTDKKWFIGETTADGDKICTAKSVDNLGEVRGLCPEGPGQRGGYRIAGLAWYAHTNDIRPDSLNGGRGLQGIQTVDTYSVRLASGNPIIEIPVPGEYSDGDDQQSVTIIPSCIDQNKDYFGCTLADFKIITPHYTETISGTLTGKGKFMAIWEDSLQGNDYDLDAGGIYEYVITDKNITITTAVTLENLGYAIGHGYVISGTTEDGLHIHSGTNGFDYNDETDVPGCNNCYGLLDGGSASSYTYTLGDSSATTLEDPLWYAAKWGGFDDLNDNKSPDLTEEWDSKINKTGEDGSDGIPDNYFLASHPQQLEDSLRSTFDAILERTSSGTAAAVVSSNVRGEGALYQAFYEPLKKQDGKETQWIGTLQASWLDSYGYTRQDCTFPRGYDETNDVCIPPTGSCVPDGKLDNYCVDQVIETYFDDIEERTRVKVFNSNEPDEFAPYSMQGVVTSYSGGSLVMEPNSLQGLVHYDSITNYTTLSPYWIEGTITSYDDTTGLVTINVPSGYWSGPADDSSSLWQVTNIYTGISGTSKTEITFETNTSLVFEVLPVGTWLVVGDTIKLSTRMPVGHLGESFDNWDFSCLEGSSATGVVVREAINILNTTENSFIVEDLDGIMTTCTMGQITSYDVQGDTGDSFDDWQVTNLESLFDRGTSATELTLANSGTKSLTVSPTDNWILAGERVNLSNYSFTTIELHQVSYLWNAREQLYLESLGDTELGYNRLYGTDNDTGTSAVQGRYITTWIDTDLDGDIDSGEYRDFDADILASASDPVKYGFFDVADTAEAAEVINFVRGIESPTTRNRTLKYATGDTSEQVMRLGDIVDSTPTVVASPQEGFNLLYQDQTYKTFRSLYQNRRVVVYAGANDGLFHAFNGGFYNVTTVNGQKTVEYTTSGYNPANGKTAVPHPLGAELWAYAPYNLLGHYQWLKDPDYALSHVYYINSKPRIFDANIFSADDNHPYGWGTVLVVGMQLGGGQMEIDTNSDDPGNSSDNVTLKSAYLIFDITNPEEPPILLGEIPMIDDSFTTVYPSVIAFRDANTDSSNLQCTDNSSNCINRWYLIFGTGPNDHESYTSSQTAKLYLFDLEQLTTSSSALPDATTSVPSNCSIEALTGTKNIISCDSSVANSFVGTPVAVDWNLDFYGDTSYFGIVGDATANSGELWRMSFSDYDSSTSDDYQPGNWEAPALFYQTNQPVMSQPVPAIDEWHNKWVFFGTGRYFASGDKTSTTIQSLYGLKDDDTGVAISSSLLLDVTDTEVYTDKSVINAPTSISGTALTDFNAIENEIDAYASGWKLDLPFISGVAATDPSTRNFTRSALLGGVLLSSVFQPSEDPCIGEGSSRLYGLYYKTGTAYPGPPIFGTDVESVAGEIKYRSRRHINLGSGVATAPAIHSGSGTGGEGVSAFTQLSTGDIVRTATTVVENVRTGKTSWSDR